MRLKQLLTHPKLRVITMLIALLLLSAGIICAAALFSVTAAVETPPTSLDADDPAIWIHPTDPNLSTMLGTYKSLGVGVYDLDGTELQSFEADQGMNNIDLRYNFPLGGEKVALAVATDRNSGRNTLAMYKINPTTRKLVSVTADPPLASAVNEVYGICMYVSPISGKYYAFITAKNGVFEQWELFDNGAGEVEGTMVRSFDVGTQTEGCVADDVFAKFYVAEEDIALWQYGAEPGDGETRTAVDYTAAGRLVADIEGLTIYYTSDNSGYLIASSQGASEYVIYDRAGDNAYVTTFDIVDGPNGIDAVSSTDGIDVSNANLGTQFPKGVFIVHDGNDDVSSTNFKLVPWEDIASGATPDLIIDTTWNPRLVGLPPVAAFAVDISSGSAPLTVKFSDQSAGIRTFWLWNFGDGTTSDQQNPIHTYTQGGPHTVTLTVSNAFGSDELTKANLIVVDGNLSAPTAAFTADKTGGEAPLSVTFTNQSSGIVEECTWQFGDGQSSTNCGPVSHVYMADGSYHVSLSVSNSIGADKATKSNYIVVGQGGEFEPTDLAFLPSILYQK